MTLITTARSVMACKGFHQIPLNFFFFYYFFSPFSFNSLSFFPNTLSFHETLTCLLALQYCKLSLAICLKISSNKILNRFLQNCFSGTVDYTHPCVQFALSYIHNGVPHILANLVLHFDAIVDIFK